MRVIQNSERGVYLSETDRDRRLRILKMVSSDHANSPFAPGDRVRAELKYSFAASDDRMESVESPGVRATQEALDEYKILAVGLHLWDK